MPGITYFSGVLQVKAYRVLQNIISKEVKKFDLNPTQWFILGQIHDDHKVRAADLANNLKVEAPLITGLSDDLVKKGLIEKLPYTKDKRVNLLILTPKGAELVPNIEALLQSQLKKLLSGLTDADLQAYLRVLETIVRNDRY